MKSPYIVGDPVTGRNFYGREQELAELLHGEGKTSHVLGMRRIGKTSLLRRVAELVPSIYLDFQALVGRADLFARQVSRELKRQRKRYDWLSEPGQADDGLIALEEAGGQAEEQAVTLFLLCDEAEGLLKFDESFLQRLRGLVWGTTRLRTIFASAKNLSQLDDLCRQWHTSPFLNNFPPPLYLAGLDDVAAAALIRQAQTDASLAISDETVAAIKQHTGHHPYLIQWLCHQLGEKSQSPEVWAVILADLQPTGQLVGRLQMDFDYLSDPERRILHAVIVKQSLPHDVAADYVHGLTRLGYLRLVGDIYVIGNTLLEQWLESADWAAKSDISAESTLTLYRKESAVVRKLIKAAFDEEELTTLCYDYFRSVFDKFSTGMTKSQKIQHLLDFANRYDQMEKLLALIEQLNPTQYAHFKDH
ncbi:MAG: ATP-binding protein [Chloroflexi bacterium]|nr:ATP-binding protein [Chloroflexota bacterium]